MAVLTLLCLLFLLLAISRLRQRKIVTAGFHGIGSMVFLLAGILLFGIAINIHTYRQLTYEREIAVLSFRQQAPQQFEVIIEYPDSKITDHFLLGGDEWQIDARILRWLPAAQLLGLNAQYRLERLSGRYQDLDQERTLPHTVYSLGEQAGLDIWSLARNYQQWLPWVDAYYGSAAYLPMTDKGRFTVSINQYGILARPLNSPAQNTLNLWH